MCDNFLHKYAPRNINDFHIDNYKIMESCVNLLICGPYGTGKTTLLITYIEKYFENSINVYADENILFINNLKDQGIHFCRNNVKMFCQTPCIAKNKKKIIAIDDIDEFSDVSQQVICNCLNKYYDNIICIATCNNTLKVFQGLKSRMAFISVFQPTLEQISDYYVHVKKQENIIIMKSLDQIIIDSCNLSYKVLLNTLQKFKILNSKIDDKNLYELITTINYNTFNTYISYIQNKDLNKSINTITKISDSGVSVIDILYEFFLYIKDAKTNISDKKKYVIIKIISKYMTIFNNNHEDSIELAFMTNEIIPVF